MYIHVPLNTSFASWVNWPFNITVPQCLCSARRRVTLPAKLKDISFTPAEGRCRWKKFFQQLTSSHDSNRCISLRTHTNTHARSCRAQRLIQCSSSCLFSHGQTDGCASSLLAWMGFISLSLKGIVKNLFTNQFCTQKICSVITNTHGALVQFNHLWLVQPLQNHCNPFMPDVEVM